LRNIEIVSLSLTNYRNYSSISLPFSQEIVVITGLNGAGKTTILDAIYYLCNGKSYFTHLDRYIYRTGSDFFRAQAKLRLDGEVREHVIKSKAGSAKVFEVDEKKLKALSELVGVFPAFMIAPRDISVLMESSIERRKVMDRTISLADRNYLKHLKTYNKLLKQRNALLKVAQKKGLSDSLLLSSIDKGMLEPASYIYQTRKNYLRELAPMINSYYADLSDRAEEITLEYETRLLDRSLDALLKENLRKDVLLGKTTAGIHKDDVLIFIEGQPIKKYASEGQLKSAVIALKLSQMEWLKKATGKKPILLLDDIFDKLDNKRVKQLLEIVQSEVASQIFITDTL